MTQTPQIRFWVVALALVLVAGSGGYWLGKRAGQDAPAVSVATAVQVPAVEEAGIPARAASVDPCASPGPNPAQLLVCVQGSAASADTRALGNLLATYLSSVAAGRAPLASLFEVLADVSHLPLDILFDYIEAEVDPQKIELASQLVQQLLQQRAVAQMGAADVDWLIANVNRLLWLTPSQVGLNLWLANLYMQQGQLDDARYHALIALGVPRFNAEASKLLQKLELGTRHSSDVDLQVVGNQYFIAARINGVAARLLLDTGASISGVTRVFMERHAIDAGRTEAVQLSTAGGVRDARRFQVRKLAFGQLVFADHPMVIFNEAEFDGFDGVLGLDILRQADFYIDEKAAKLRIF